MELMDKLTILADAAMYDAACTSSGVDRAGGGGRRLPAAGEGGTVLGGAPRAGR